MFVFVRSRLHSGINYGGGGGGGGGSGKGEEEDEGITETNVRFPSERLLSANSSILYNPNNTGVINKASKNEEDSDNDELVKKSSDAPTISMTTTTQTPKPSLLVARPSLNSILGANTTPGIDPNRSNRIRKSSSTNRFQRAKTAVTSKSTTRNMQFERPVQSAWTGAALSTAPASTSSSTSTNPLNAHRRVVFAGKHGVHISSDSSNSNSNEQQTSTGNKQTIKIFYFILFFLSFKIQLVYFESQNNK